MYAGARRALSEAGYRQYELSNFARPGRECVQNLAYWTRKEYLGVGCAAHSFMRGIRWGNVTSLTDYLVAMEAGESPAAERTRVGEADARFEALMLGLRLTEGVSARAFTSRYGRTIERLWGDRLPALVERGLVEWSGGWLRLTERGMDLQNVVLVELMDANG